MKKPALDASKTFLLLQAAVDSNILTVQQKMALNLPINRQLKEHLESRAPRIQRSLLEVDQTHSHLNIQELGKSQQLTLGKMKKLTPLPASLGCASTMSQSRLSSQHKGPQPQGSAAQASQKQIKEQTIKEDLQSSSQNRSSSSSHSSSSAKSQHSQDQQLDLQEKRTSQSQRHSSKRPEAVDPGETSQFSNSDSKGASILRKRQHTEISDYNPPADETYPNEESKQPPSKKKKGQQQGSQPQQKMQKPQQKRAFKTIHEVRYASNKEIKDALTQETVKTFQLADMPGLNEPMVRADGQPRFTTNNMRIYGDREARKQKNNTPIQHLYKDGVINLESGLDGVGGLLQMPKSDPEMKKIVETAIRFIFTDACIAKFKFMERLSARAELVECVKELLVLAHYGAHMCTNHYDKVGHTNVYDRFLPQMNCRRLVYQQAPLDRQDLKTLLLVLYQDVNCKEGLEKAQLVNKSIDDNENFDSNAAVLDVEMKGQHNSLKSFPTYQGVKYMHDDVNLYENVSMCGGSSAKDRRKSDLNDSINIATGNNNTLSLLCSGTPSVSQLFTTLLRKHKEMLYQRMSAVGTLLMSNLTMNLLLFRNAEVAFAGQMKFFNSKGKEVDDINKDNVENANDIAAAKVEDIGKPIYCDLVYSENLAGKVDAGMANFEIAAFKIMELMRLSLWTKPAILQVVWRDPLTQLEYVLTTNLSLTQAQGPLAKMVLKVRNCTLKQNIEGQADIEASDEAKDFKSDIDMAARHLDRGRLAFDCKSATDSSNKAFVLTTSELPQKEQQWKIMEKPQMKAHVDKYTNQLFRLVYHMFLQSAEVTSLGFKSAIDSVTKTNNKAAAYQKLSRLEAVSANLFVMVQCDLKLKTPEQKFLALATLAMGSSETTRHMEICNNQRNLGTALEKARNVIDFEVEDSWFAEAHQYQQTFSASSQNSFLKCYDAFTSEEQKLVLRKMEKGHQKKVIKRFDLAIQQKQLVALMHQVVEEKREGVLQNEEFLPLMVLRILEYFRENVAMDVYFTAWAVLTYYQRNFPLQMSQSEPYLLKAIKLMVMTSKIEYRFAAQKNEYACTKSLLRAEIRHFPNVHLEVGQFGLSLGKKSGQSIRANFNNDDTIHVVGPLFYAKLIDILLLLIDVWQRNAEDDVPKFDFFSEVYMQELVIQNFLTWLEAPTLGFVTWNNQTTFRLACQNARFTFNLQQGAPPSMNAYYQKMFACRNDPKQMRKELQKLCKEYFAGSPQEEKLRLQSVAKYFESIEKGALDFHMDGKGSDFYLMQRYLAVPRPSYAAVKVNKVQEKETQKKTVAFHDNLNVQKAQQKKPNGKQNPKGAR